MTSGIPRGDPTPSMDEPIVLDPHWAAVLDSDDPTTPIATVDRLRDELRTLTATLPRVPVADVEDRTIDAAGRRVKIRIYRPSATVYIPVLAVYLHGGGWVAGDLDTHDPLCRQIVHHSNATVIAVDYPLAPEHPYPAALRTTIDAFDWAHHHRHALGLDPATPIAFVGDSSGANLAAAATLKLTTTRTDDRLPSGLIVTHPVLQPGTDTSSHRYYGNGFGLTSRRLEQLWQHYVPQHELLRQPTAAPLLATTLARFPPTWVQTAQYDPARSDGDNFVVRLRADGVTTRHTCYRGQIHGFQTAFNQIPSAADSLREIGTALATLIEA
jgi:acetyl esterase